MSDYQHREYLSVSEVSAYTGLMVRDIHRLVKSGEMTAFKSASGQYRFRLHQIKTFRRVKMPIANNNAIPNENIIKVNNTQQQIIVGDSRDIHNINDNSVHLVITSPPYFNAKMYSAKQDVDLGNIHDLDSYLTELSRVWMEVFRVLQPGRKFFLNIMNLPVREKNSFRTINLVGKNIDECERIGFVFKRDIVWHKTNGVRAHFGTYPNPGGILINNMHEFILEFEKPAYGITRKYMHVSEQQRAESKLDKDFWLSIKNSDVWLIKPEKSGSWREHSAPFPQELPSRLIRAYSYVGETILDPFAGSGTTLVAATQLGRHGVGVDINADFCEMAARRISSILI